MKYSYVTAPWVEFSDCKLETSCSDITFVLARAANTDLYIVSDRSLSSSSVSVVGRIALHHSEEILHQICSLRVFLSYYVMDIHI
ncbi:hypothetical protein GDO78_005477 [Eleutherodactylus coqui]|uniref:Uncharacterized protein n=1 Tax=Eleutherodactylus coqui TaxID=57060 RepID=A0A8J6KHS1_ELECQ|nr:hypothetical protein GDO78_005477 [Eleutherodactylus coqui]